MARYTKFCDDQSIRSRVILGKPEGGCLTPPCAGDRDAGSGVLRVLGHPQLHTRKSVLNSI